MSPGALGRPFNFKKEKLKVGNPGSMRSRLLPTTFLPFLNFTSATGRQGERLRFFFTTYLTYLVLGVCDDCVLKFLFSRRDFGVLQVTSTSTTSTTRLRSKPLREGGRGRWVGGLGWERSGEGGGGG